MQRQELGEWNWRNRLTSWRLSSGQIDAQVGLRDKQGRFKGQIVTTDRYQLKADTVIKLVHPNEGLAKGITINK